MMKLVKREEYEAPITTKRVVQMEGSVCAASGDKMEPKMTISAGTQEDTGFDIRFDRDVDWSKE